MLFSRSQPRKVPFKPVYPDYEKEKDIVEYQVVDTVEKTGEGDSDFIIVKKVIESSRMNRQKYYDEQAKGHTIYAMIEKALIAGDPSVLHTGHEGFYGDFSNLPLDRSDWLKNKEAVAKALASLDPDLVGDDIFKFLKDVTPEDIAKFYADKEAAKNKEKEGVE